MLFRVYSIPSLIRLPRCILNISAQHRASTDPNVLSIWSYLAPFLERNHHKCIVFYASWVSVQEVLWIVQDIYRILSMDACKPVFRSTFPITSTKSHIGYCRSHWKVHLTCAGSAVTHRGCTVSILRAGMLCFSALKTALYQHRISISS